LSEHSNRACDGVGLDEIVGLLVERQQAIDLRRSPAFSRHA
jgi:hypothetical protein